MVMRDSKGKRRKVAKGPSNFKQRAFEERSAGETLGESKLQEPDASAPPTRKKVKK
jgi:hypothetical protein